MAVFSVLVMTAAPPTQAAEAGGAYVKLDGREALLRSVELFLNRDNVKQIQLAVLQDMIDEAKRKYGPHLGFTGVKLLAGGPKWMDQIKSAADTLSPECTHVIVHDAARPIVPYSDIDAVMEAAEKNDAVGLVTPVRSTLVEIDQNCKDACKALAYHLPARFMYLLTPQAFSRETFLQMAQTGQEVAPGDATLVKGSPLNIRIGGGGDASMAKAMLNMLPKPKVKPPSSPFEEAQW